MSDRDRPNRAVSRPSVYTLEPGAPFARVLATGILERFGSDPNILGRVTVFVPTRRAVRTLRDAFLQAAEGKPLLLPRLRPIGDVEEDDPELYDMAPDTGQGMDLRPALTPLRRHLLLTRLIMSSPGFSADDEPEQAGLAAALARELGRLIDRVHTEGLSFAGFKDLVPEAYALHWQRTVDFLTLVTDHWPQILDEMGFMEAAERRNLLLELESGRWQNDTVREPVIAAGSTGSIPATAHLLGSIARHPEGEIILPGLDLDLDEESWRTIGETHPQHGLKQLLARISVARVEVEPWPFGQAAHSPSPETRDRGRLIAEALRPAETTDAWAAARALPETATAGLARIDAPTPREEAGMIALALREVLETPGKTAALITPDRHLARRVAADLRRWNIEIDDSAGLPLASSLPGAFLRLILQAAIDGLAPVPLLAMLKHPLAAGGEKPADFRALARQLEEKTMRGPRPERGFKGLRAALGKGSKTTALAKWLGSLEKMLAPLLAEMSKDGRPLAGLAEAHLKAAEALAATDEIAGAERLWTGDAGESLSLFFRELIDASDDLAPLSGDQYPALLDQLMSGRVVRPGFGKEPRLNIWGLLEARLQSADLLILGGMNEGTWPPETGADPWMSRPMQADFGLPLPERRIGLSAHDFVQAANQPAVLLTRSEKVDGQPTVPSRWLQRIEAVAGGPIAGPTTYAGWLAALDKPERFVDIEPPRPCPPFEARPRALSVTRIETWKRDPYALYAREILKLRPLEPLDANPGAAEKGSIIHQALENFLSSHRGKLPEDAVERLLDCGKTAFAEALARPAVWAFWWPRFEKIARWFVEHETARRATATPAAIEVWGELDMPGLARGFRLTGKADRIDRMDGGGLSVIDYKTGAAPSEKSVAAGFSPQLPLEAAMAERGAFKGLKPGPVAELAYWELSGRTPAGRERPLGLDAHETAEQALAGLARLVSTFDDPATPYLSNPRPAYAGYSEYDHLARVGEWAAEWEKRR